MSTVTTATVTATSCSSHVYHQWHFPMIRLIIFMTSGVQALDNQQAAHIVAHVIQTKGPHIIRAHRGTHNSKEHHTIT